LSNLSVAGRSEGWTLIGPFRIPRALLPGLALTFLLMLAVAVLSKGINQPPLIDWDEATYAEVAHEAVAHHSFLDFGFNGQSYVKKPPLLFWMIAASFKAFGESEFSARLPSVVMGVGTLLLICGLVAGDFGWLAGLLAGILPLGFYFFVARGGRECATDAPLIFFSTLAIFALDRARSNRRWAPAVGVACGLALLSKGAAGLIPLSVVVIALLALPAFSQLGVASATMIVAASAIVAGPWFVYELIHNGPVFWTSYIKHETLMRIAEHLEDKRAAAGFTTRTFLSEVRFLWPLLLPLAGLSFAAMRSRGWRIMQCIPASVKVWFLWFGMAFTAACVVQTKLGWYVLPALIPVALLGASAVAGAFRQAGPARNYCRPLAAAALLLLPVTAAPRWARNESSFALQRTRSRPSYEMAMRAIAFAAVRGGGELYFAGPPLPTLVYYSGMRCHFVSPGEPDFELADLGGNPISVSYHELVLRDTRGVVTAVDNFDEEWDASGPPSEWRHPLTETPDMQQDVKPSAECLLSQKTS
jgi:4-amino-4-deoxy-L-arabinose transferase-like glycosyltransferase